jgi:hypothetical protein
MATLSRKQTDQAVKTLSTMVITGKNAVKMLQVAKALQGNKKLPLWANEFEWQATFANVANIEKAAKSDSYADFCTLFNLNQKGSKLTENQIELFKQLNKIQLFAATATMKAIKFKLENPEPELDLPTPPKYNTPEQPEQPEQPVDQVAQVLAMLKSMTAEQRATIASELAIMQLDQADDMAATGT